MYINKLNLRAFGKFTFKKIYLANKLNIVYGENESGKTTIHNFIEAMLYGFGSDEEGRKKYELYKPWHSSFYKGSMTMSDKNSDRYYISKDFLLGTLQVFKKENNSDAEDVVLQENVTHPGEHFFNLSKLSYRNTISIRQLGNKTEEELSNELKSKIINLSKTKNEEISVDRAIEKLIDIKEQAGSENNAKTLLGQYYLRIEELRLESEKAKNSRRQVMYLSIEKKKQQKKMNDLVMRVEEVQNKLSNHELSLKWDKLNKAEPMKKELDNITDELSKVGNVMPLNNYSEDYNEIIKISKNMEVISTQRHEKNNEKLELQNKLDTLKEDISNLIDDNFQINKLNQYYDKNIDNIEKIEALKNKISLLKNEANLINIEEIQRFLEDYNLMSELKTQLELTEVLLNDEAYNKIKKFRDSENAKSIIAFILASLLTLSSAALSYLGYYYNIIELYYTAGVLLPGIALYFISNKNNARKKAWEEEIYNIEQELKYNENLIKNLKYYIQDILKRWNLKSYEEINEVLTNKIDGKNLYDEKNNTILEHERLIRELEIENTFAIDYIKKMLEPFSINKISHDPIDMINDAYKRKDSVKNEKYRLLANISHLDALLNKLDSQYNLEATKLKEILNKHNFSSKDEFVTAAENYDTYKKLIERKEYIENIVKNVMGIDSYDRLHGELNNSPYLEIVELDKNEQQLNIYKMNSEISNIKENISSISKEVEELENNSRSLAQIEEEISFYEDKIKSFKDRIQAANLAIEKIVMISDYIKVDFLPLLEKSISKNFSYLTSNKYKKVSVDENMNITVQSENEDNIILESLSGGTLDQLYLSLRIGLSSLISGKENIPLILDDSFVQYDNKRLKRSIEMLLKESERRQVIIFTCQKREMEIANQLSDKINYIKL